MTECQATLNDDTLVLDTGRLRRAFTWNAGRLITRRVENTACGVAWDMWAGQPRRPARVGSGIAGADA